IKILRPCKVQFATIRTETKCRLDSCFRQSQARRCMIQAEEVEEVMSVREHAIGLEKCSIMRDSLVQKICRLAQIRVPAGAIALHRNKVFCATVKIKRGEIGRGWPLNSQFLSG